MKINNNNQISNFFFNLSNKLKKQHVFLFPFHFFQIGNNSNYLIGKSINPIISPLIKIPTVLVPGQKNNSLQIEPSKIDQQSLIKTALKNNNLKLALKLVEKQRKESLPIDPQSASTLLSKIAKSNNFDLFNYLMNIPGIDVNVQDCNNKTALHYALKRGQTHKAKALLEKGANLGLEDKNGMTPVHEALNLNSVKFLIDQNVDISKKDHLGMSLLSRAIASGKTEIVKYLSEKKPELFEGNDQELIELAKCSCLKNEFQFSHVRQNFTKNREKRVLDTLSYLCKNHPQFLKAKDENGQTLLHHAYKYGNKKTVQTLLKNGANPDIRDMQKRTPLEAGLEINNNAIVFTDQNKHMSEAYNNFVTCTKKNPKIGNPLLSLLQARNPKFYDSKKSRDKKLNGFLEEVDRLASKKTPWLEHTLEHVLKMNHKIPLSRHTLFEIEKLASQVKGNKKLETKLFLALQTHPNIREVKNAVHTMKHTDVKKAFGRDGKDFFAEPFVKQVELLNAAEVFRMRKAAPCASDIIKQKDTIHPKLLEKSLKVLEKVGIPQKQDHFLELLENPKQNDKTKIQTLKTMASTVKDPKNSEEIKRLVSTLQTNPKLSSEICNALAKYDFSSCDPKIYDDLIALSKECNSPKAQRGFARVLTLLPNERALEQALSIVNSPAWDHVDKKSHLKNRDEHIGNYNMFTHKPDFLQNRDAMRKIIAERLVNLKWKSIEENVETEYQRYLDNPEHFQSLEKVKNKIYSLNPTQRHIPFGLHLPKDRVVMRGISSKKGDALGQAAFVDLLTKGAGSSDLSLFDQKANGTWSKVGQTFTSTSLKYVLDGDYFNANGSLMAIDSNFLNEQMLRGEGRFEKENKINPISFSTIPHHAFKKLYIPRAEQGEITQLAQGNTLPGKTDGALQDASQRVLKRISKKLQERVGDTSPLIDRIGYVDTPRPNESFKSQMKQKLSQEGLKPIKTKELVQENIKRQIAKQILQNSIQNQDLKRCLQIACI